MEPDSPVAVGWREWVALPDLALLRLRAKIDTGARTSALHVESQWRFTEAGAAWVGFHVRPSLKAAPLEAVAEIIDEREVSDSGGHRTVRPFIRTRLRLAGLCREVDINLTHRHGMLFPMLLGRTALADAFTVDPAASFLHGRPPHGRPHRRRAP